MTRRINHREIGKYFEVNENKATTSPNLRDMAKAGLRELWLQMCIFEESSQTNYQILYHKKKNRKKRANEWGGGEESKARKREEIMKTKLQINEI